MGIAQVAAPSLPVAIAAVAGAVGAAQCRLACNLPPLRLTSRQRAARSSRCSTRSADAANVRIVTYNVLAPSLCSEKRFPHCKKEDLDEPVRWERVSAKLEETLAGSLPTVVCLQEVSESWAARLHTLFQQRGWHFTYALTPMTYFKPMGVALAWSNAAFELEELRILRPGDEVRAPRLPKLSGLRLLLNRVTKGRLFGPPAALEPWRIADQKQNRLLAARLRNRETGHSFAVVTYHMPCLFGDPPKRQAKAIHSAILRHLATRFASGGDLVLAGDFNTLPGVSELQIVQSGALDADDPAFPPSTHGLQLSKWLLAKPQHRLRSAYAEALGAEPPFTNYAWIEDEPGPFQETIDYVFVSERVEVVDVQALPSAVPGEPVYPSAEEPSDHVLLAADLRLGGMDSDRTK